MLGETVGSYRITAKLGEGGMGVVYVAEHALIGQKAAVKLLLPELSHNKQIVDRFFNEARAAARMKHPGIVGIYDFGYHAGGSAYIVMELLEGESLSARLRARGRLGEEEALRLARQVAGTLAVAHGKGIVHRDLKPDNIYLVPDAEVAGGERAKILDFGIAKLVTDAGSASSTRTGAVMGSPTYMAPEQCRGLSTIDERADIYALGCVLYELLCGRPPFLGEGAGDVMAKHIYEAPPPPRSLGAAMSPRVEAVIVRALAKAPGDRQPSMRELVAELDACTGGRLDTGRFQRLPSQGMHVPAAPTDPTIAPLLTPPRGTTMSGAAGQVGGAERPSRAWMVPAAVALVALAAAGGILWVTRDGGRAAERPAAAAAPAPLPPVAAAPPDAGVPDAAVTVDAAVPEVRVAPKPPSPRKPRTLPEPKRKRGQPPKLFGGK